MGKTLTNIAIALGLATVGFAGFYLYQQRTAIPLDIVQAYDLSDVLDRTNAFIGYRQQLESTVIDSALFDDKRFTSLQSFSTDVVEQPIGREDPFSQSSRLPIIDVALEREAQ